MLTELAQWFTPAIVILGFLFTARTIRNQRVDMESRTDRMESRMDRMESRLTERIDGVESRLAARIDGLESQYSDLRERMGRIDGTLDLLRKSFVENRRGTAT